MGDSSTCTALSNALHSQTPSTAQMAAAAALLPDTQQEKEKRMEFTRHELCYNITLEETPFCDFTGTLLLSFYMLLLMQLLYKFYLLIFN